MNIIHYYEYIGHSFIEIKYCFVLLKLNLLTGRYARIESINRWFIQVYNIVSTIMKATAILVWYGILCKLCYNLWKNKRY